MKKYTEKLLQDPETSDYSDVIPAGRKIRNYKNFILKPLL